MFTFSVFLLLCSVFTGYFTFEISHLSPLDYNVLKNLPSLWKSLPAGFKYKYVDASGVIHKSKPSVNAVEVAASPSVSGRAHYDAALIVSHMIRHMPSSIFSRVSTHGSVGVFTKSEKLTIYPEYYRLANTPECHNRCDGSCKRTCTFDGRKYETMAAVGGKRAAILDDNVMCTSRDPYHHRENLLVHEFAHVILSRGLNQTMHNKVKSAYTHAKSKALWASSAYVMTNYNEYFAEATAAWYNVIHRNSAGGMNKCGTSHHCPSASQARAYIHKHDPRLYDILNYVYNNGNVNLPGGITTCIEDKK
ncbi:uncharacterized protein LOC121377556 [Gigantopelta aegis]|uniref:uncharacterized protein LOC121377556 n=1 Tax=Gigantopelta aegis TaxID=1735272 RepID=UPI001B88DE37|nr:uncharacterized protein LOC121377556 [Gigantopelta aegis]